MWSVFEYTIVHWYNMNTVVNNQDMNREDYDKEPVSTVPSDSSSKPAKVECIK